MDERQSVLGFTEAELGFFLAALCLVLWLVSTAAAPPPTEPPPVEAMVPADSASTLEEKLAAARLERDSLDDAYQRLRDSVSGILPNCTRIGRAEGPMWTITVSGRDRVRFGRELMSFQEFGARTWAERKPVIGTCWHQVVVRFPRATPGSVTENARGQLARLRLRISRVEWVRQ
jgi:hypothetical protein